MELDNFLFIHTFWSLELKALKYVTGIDNCYELTHEFKKKLQFHKLPMCSFASH